MFSITQSNGAVRMPLQEWSAQCSVFCSIRLLTGYMAQTTTWFLIMARCSKQFTSYFGIKSHVSTTVKLFPNQGKQSEPLSREKHKTDNV